MSSTRFTILAATAAVAAVAAPAASADPVVTQATGQNAAAIQAAVDSYRNSLGANNGGDPAQAGGRREINWDGVPDDRSAPSFMPDGQFRARGAVFSTPGLGVQVSADDNDDNGNPDADADQVQFTNLNPTYAAEFATFSPERLFAPVGSNITNTEFVIPASDTPAQTNGFGAVFTDVDQAGATTIELLDAKGASLGVYPVPASPGSETLSFLGVKLDPGVGAAAARITTGTAALVAPPGVSPDDGPAADIVVMDDFIYGEPQPVPADQPDPVDPPDPADQPDVEAPRLTLEGVSKRVNLKAFSKGLKLKLTTDEPATIDASLRAKARSVEFARAKTNVLLAERSLGLDAGQRKVTLKPKRSSLRGAESLKAEVRVTATDEAGNRTTVKRKITVG
jgi:hypothetical protein